VDRLPFLGETTFKNQKQLQGGLVAHFFKASIPMTAS
jgi:hypothetical protein